MAVEKWQAGERLKAVVGRQRQQEVVRKVQQVGTREGKGSRCRERSVAERTQNRIVGAAILVASGTQRRRRGSARAHSASAARRAVCGEKGVMVPIWRRSVQSSRQQVVTAWFRNRAVPPRKTSVFKRRNAAIAVRSGGYR